MSVLPIAPLPAATGSAALPSSPGTNDAMSFDAHVVVASQKPVTCLANGPSPAGSHSGNQSEAQLRSAGTAANKAVEKAIEKAIDKTRGGEMAEADRQDPDIGGSAGDSGKAVPARTSLVAKPIADTDPTFQIIYASNLPGNNRHPLL